MTRPALSLLLATTLALSARAVDLVPVGPVRLEGKIAHGDNLSAVHADGSFLLLASDEGNLVQILRGDGATYSRVADLPLNASGEEVDVEGLASEGGLYTAVGSHSAKRSKLKPNGTLAQNRALMRLAQPEPARDVVAQFRLDAAGTPVDVRLGTLRPFFEKDPVLAPFAPLPGKENGIDIEGVAMRDGELYVGLRGPVLRGNWVPVVRCRFAKRIEAGELLYLNLEGRGVRDLCRVGDEFLVLAGPAGEEPLTFQIYLWDGADTLPGKRPGGARPGRLKLLGDLPRPEHGRPEGMTVTRLTPRGCEVLVLFDGRPLGGPTRYNLDWK